MVSPDIRAGVALLIAALCAEGQSTIRNVGQIDRGYERIEERLRMLGAHIQRIDNRNSGRLTKPPARMDPERMDRQPEKPMDPIQMTRLLLWLDEEHRKDKTELQFLREKLLAQGPVMDSQAAQIRDLAAKLAFLKTQTARMSPLDEGLSQTKNQIAQLKEQLDRYQEETDRSDRLARPRSSTCLSRAPPWSSAWRSCRARSPFRCPRLQALSDDFKRVMAVFPQFEAIRQQVSALSTRLPVLEAEDRRSNDRLATWSAALRTLKNGQVRIQESIASASKSRGTSPTSGRPRPRRCSAALRNERPRCSCSSATDRRTRRGWSASWPRWMRCRHARAGPEARVARLEEQIAHGRPRLTRLQDLASPCSRSRRAWPHLLSAVRGALLR